MNNIIFKSIPKKIILLLALITLTGCSTIDSYRSPVATHSLPKIPEIKRQQTINSRYVPPEKATARAPVVPKTVIQPYPKTIVQPKQIQKLTEQQKLEQQQSDQQQAQKNATVEIDPYASIPESSAKATPRKLPKKSAPSVSYESPAIKTLMISARADIALGKSRSAISKLERGLRIEPQNANLWHMLAKAHYANSAYLHSISMAKKSNSNTNNDDLIAENWKLIKLAGERSGNASAIKEALDYIKLNP